MNWFSRIFNTNSIKGICRHSATYRGPVVTAATKKIQLTITSTPDGSTYNWASIASGFNPNAIVSVKIWRV